ncbi:MAG: T9SS type A sorting domain-containing protein [Bacteroidales bacterium]
MDSPGLSVITNAEQTIQELIQGINEVKTGHHESVIVGESMGGLITRVALKNLENEGYDHQCRLYVSYDSPHKGANIPPGVQYLVYRIFNILQPYPLQFNFFVDLLVAIFESTSATTTNIDVQAIYEKLISEGAQEMLVNHIFGHDEYNGLQDFLTELGFPDYCRNVAFANGSNAVTHQGIDPGSPYFPEISTLTFPLRTSLECKYSGVNQNLMVFGATIKLWFFGWNTITEIGDYYTFDEKFYADAPAGFWGKYDNNDYKISFLPIVSAIDLVQDLIDMHNLDYFVIDNEELTKSWYIDNEDVPFNDIYSEVENSRHISKINTFNNLDRNEIMYDNMHLQNRVINNTRDFEASEMILAGKDVTPANWDKTIDVNDFVVADGGNVTFTAGHTIRLEDGFVVEPGGHFSAHIDNNLIVNKSKIITSVPEIAGNKYAYIQNSYFVKYSNKNDNICWRLTGEKTDICITGLEFAVPSNLICGQYTLYCTKTDNNGQATHTKVIEVLPESRLGFLKKIVNPVKKVVEATIDPAINENSDDINILPNPNNGRFELQINLLKIGQSFSIEILDFSGKPVKQYSNIIQNKYKIDISDLSKGIYFVKIQSGDKTFIEKVVYQ